MPAHHSTSGTQCHACNFGCYISENTNGCIRTDTHLVRHCVMINIVSMEPVSTINYINTLYLNYE